MEILRVFGTNLKKYREEKNISQEKFAEIAGLHRTYISDVERFQRSISTTGGYMSETNIDSTLLSSESNQRKPIDIPDFLVDKNKKMIKGVN